MSKEISYLKAKKWIGNTYREPFYQDKGYGRQFYRTWRRRVEKHQVRKMLQYQDYDDYTIRKERELIKGAYFFMNKRLIHKCECKLCMKFRDVKYWRYCG